MTTQVSERHPSANPILDVAGVTVRFGGLTAVHDATFGIQPGQITALIGPNGAGKSTLMNVISGFIRPNEGSVRFRDHDMTAIRPDRAPALGLSRTFQHVDVMQRMTVCENVLVALQGQIGDRAARVMLSPIAWRRERRRNIDRVLEIIESVALHGRADVLASDLSYGEQKLLVLARLIATDAELLLLDEPGAGMPSSSLDQIGQLLQGLVRQEGKTVVIVDHNMQLILNYAEQIIVLHHGEVIAAGPPNQIRANPDVLRVYMSREVDPGEQTPNEVGRTGPHDA